MTELLAPSRQSNYSRPEGQVKFDLDCESVGILPPMTVSKWSPAEEQLKAFGARLAAARKAKGLSLEDVGARFGYGSGKGAPWTWENGTQPPVFLLAELAKLYGTTIDYLLTGADSTAWPFPSVTRELVASLPEQHVNTIETVINALSGMPEIDTSPDKYIHTDPDNPRAAVRSALETPGRHVGNDHRDEREKKAARGGSR